MHKVAAFWVFLGLWLANSARILFYGIATDLIFGGVVMTAFIVLLVRRFPNPPMLIIFSFASLQLIYVFGFLLNISYPGLRDCVSIFFVSIIFLFCHRYSNLLTQGHLLIIYVLMAVGTILSVLFSSSAPNINVSAGISAYSIMILGVVLISRSKAKAIIGQHVWPHVIFLLAAIMGAIFRYRVLTGLSLLSLMIYWVIPIFLKNSVRSLVLYVCAISTICFVVIVIGTPWFDPVLIELDSSFQKWGWDRLLSGRETLWKGAITDIAQSPGLGYRPGAVPMLPTIVHNSDPLVMINRGRTFENVEGDLSAHNLFLQVGVQTGIPGMIALTLLFAALFLSICSRAGNKVAPLQSFIATCSIIVIFHSTFDVFLTQNVLTQGTLAWILLGLGTGEINARRHSRW